MKIEQLLLSGTLMCGLMVGCITHRSREVSSGTGAHAVHNEQLQRVMRSMEALHIEELPQELDPKVELENEKRRLRRVLSALAGAAEQIPGIVTEVELTAEQASEFVELASELQRRALELEESLSSLRRDEIRGQFSRLQETCHECHRQFRFIPQLGTHAKGSLPR